MGDPGVGKTSLLLTYQQGGFPYQFLPISFDTVTNNIQINNSLVELSLWNTNGLDDYDRLRPLSYPDTNLFLVVFSVVSPSSFQSVTSKWIPELQNHSPSTPYLLVGSKTDLREDTKYIETQGVTPIQFDQGQLLAQEIKAIQYLEVSAVKNEGVKVLFEEAISWGLYGRPMKRTHKSKGGCILL
uniref:Uncharacterized protein n=1 Tax=Arcella intermedia TaxID=1963864 RepID=A0A6B2LJV5_9EUKA